MKSAQSMEQIIETLLAKLKPLKFGPPVSHVYNPLVYARRSYDCYWQKYGVAPKEIVLLGMNPGPWGMAQTGVPFGDVEMVRGWLGIEAVVESPAKPHPKRPVQGFACARGEVSGRRLWGWAREKWITPKAFFKRFWVANYCPLVFMEEGGRNRTPDKLHRAEKEPLISACDEALRQTVRMLRPRMVIGVGHFAAQRAERALAGKDLHIGRISHPSPANPKANRGWSELATRELSALGVDL